MKKRNDPSTCKIIKLSIQTISIPSVEESRYSAESLLNILQKRECDIDSRAPNSQVQFQIIMRKYMSRD